MASDVKRVVRENVRSLIQAGSGPLKPNESGVTRLVNLGIANGTAQRVLDEDSDLRLETVEQVAQALKVSPWELMTPGLQVKVVAWRDLNGFEAQLVTLFRKLSQDEQHDHLIELNLKTDRDGDQASSHSPYIGVNRRKKALGHEPERRSATRFEDRPPSSSPPPRKRGTQ